MSTTGLMNRLADDLRAVRIGFKCWLIDSYAESLAVDGVPVSVVVHRVYDEDGKQVTWTRDWRILADWFEQRRLEAGETLTEDHEGEL